MSDPTIQTGDYIPRKFADFLSWGMNFAQLTALDPAKYGLDAADVAKIQNREQRFAEAYKKAEAPSTRTTDIVRARNDARREAEAVYRQYAQRIKHHPGMTWKDLSSLGIHLDDLGRTPIGAPTSAPLVHIICAPNGRHVIRYADENTPAARRKPHGVKLFQLYAAVTKRGTADVRLAKHLGDFGRQPIRIAWSAAEAGLTASYFGRWMSAKGLKGPWSLPRSMVIVGGAAGGHCGDDDRLQLVQPRGVVTATASGVQRAA